MDVVKEGVKSFGALEEGQVGKKFQTGISQRVHP